MQNQVLTTEQELTKAKLDITDRDYLIESLNKEIAKLRSNLSTEKGECLFYMNYIVLIP